MANQTSLNATFFALRKREKSGVLTAASLAFLIGSVLIVAVFAVALWSTLVPVIGWYGDVLNASAKGDPAAMAAIAPPPGLFILGPAYLLFLFLIFVLLASYEAACHRWMIRGETGGLFGLTFGADMWRVYATYWVWFIFFLLAYIGCIVVAVVLGMSAASAGGKDGAGAAGLAVVVGLIVYLIAWLYLSVRLAPAAATSVGRGQFSFFAAWTVTRGRFWALFGSFLLLILIYLVVGLVLSGVFFSVVMGSAMSGIDPASVAQNPETILQVYMQAFSSFFSNPTSIALYVAFQIASSLIGLVFYTLFFGVNARAVEAALAEGKIVKAA